LWVNSTCSQKTWRNLPEKQETQEDEAQIQTQKIHIKEGILSKMKIENYDGK